MSELILFGGAVVLFSALTCLLVLAEQQRHRPASRHRCRVTRGEVLLEASEIVAVAGLWLLGFYVLAADLLLTLGHHVSYSLAWAPSLSM